MKIARHRKADPLSQANFQALLVAAPSTVYLALWSIQRWSAARISEALALTWANVAGEKVTYRRRYIKTKTTRQVP